MFMFDDHRLMLQAITRCFVEKLLAAVTVLPLTVPMSIILLAILQQL